jgi:hypothetical protein
MIYRLTARLAVTALAACACGLAMGCSQGDGGISSVAGASESPAATPHGRADTGAGAPADTKKQTEAPAPAKRKPGAPVKLAGLFRYVGAFRLPSGKVGESRYGYGGTALAFNPEKKSLFVVGHDHDQAVGEVEIPATAVNSTKQDDLPVARVLQPLVRYSRRCRTGPWRTTSRSAA